MGTTVTEARTRETVLDDLLFYRHRAARLTCVDPDFAVCHAVLNELLTELEQLK